MRDIEIYERYVKAPCGLGDLLASTLDEKVWRATEPHTPSPLARLEAVAELRRRGIDSGVLIAPLMPGIDDAPEQASRSSTAPVKRASFLGGAALHLRDEVRDVFFAWLQAKRPDPHPPLREALLGVSVPTSDLDSAVGSTASSRVGAARELRARAPAALLRRRW